MLISCARPRKKASTTDESFASPGDEEHFKDPHTMIISAAGVAPAALLTPGDKALAYARLDARLNAERRFTEICYGNSIRPCEPKRRIDPRLAEALRTDLKPVREKCTDQSKTEPVTCRILFEFQYEHLKSVCDAARSEDGMKILTAGCGAW